MLTKFNLIEITDIKEVTIECPVYDFEVAKDHSYIANDIVVHNSVCTTRKMTGVGMPQLSAIIECADSAHGLGGHVCADGGITCPGDLGKAFGAGADFVMMGGVFAGHDECDGEITNAVKTLKKEVIVKSAASNDMRNTWDPWREHTFILNGEEYTLSTLVGNDPAYWCEMPKHFIDHTPSETSKMKFYGMSSKEAQEKHNGGVKKHRAAEGKCVEVPYKGAVENTILEYLGGLRSTCTYIGARELKHMSKCTTFVKVHNQINNIFGK